ncbi:MAG: hypothetical protein V7720_08235 [Halioglobus sp.]
MDSLYNVYYAGELLDGQQLEQVRARLASLFKADDATLDKLFSGTAQLVKRECDKTTALKYQQAMENAGAKPLIKAAKATAPPEPEPEPEPKTAQEPAKAQTAAERIAALAAAPDQGSYDEPESAANASQSAIDNDSDLNLSPEGTEVLKPEERSEQVVADIDTSDLEVDEQSQRLSEEASAPPPAPDTSHLSMGEVGDEIPTLATEQQPTVPDTEGLTLTPEGTDFSDCAAPQAQAPVLDLSGIDLAPQGSDVLEEAHRNKPKPPPPATDHISLQD